MKTLSFWKKSIYSALVFFGTIIVLSVGYATWNATMSKVTTGSPLTANAWNALVDNITDLDSRWSRVGSDIAFTGGNVGIGTPTPGAKLDIAWQVKITGGTPGAGKVLTSDANGLASWTSQFDTYSNTTSYIAQNIALTPATQNFATVMTLPSAGTYLIWITARVDLGATSSTHFFLSTSPAGTPLFGVNLINNTSTTGITTTYSNMWVLSVAGSATIYVGGLSGWGTLAYIGVNQSTAGYLKLK